MATTPAPARALNGDAIRVLIIDDDRFHAETVAETLEKVGYDCTVAFSGTEGSRRIETDQWDVILTDLKMADVDGLAILRKAKELLPESEVVMITGYGDVRMTVQAMKAGAVEFLTKQLYPLGAIVTLSKFGRRQARRLTERFNLIFNQFPHFILDGTGWSCHHGKPPANSLAQT